MDLGGDFRTVAAGSYYAAALSLARREGRIGQGAADPLMERRAYWDIKRDGGGPTRGPSGSFFFSSSDLRARNPELDLPRDGRAAAQCRCGLAEGHRHVRHHLRFAA